MKTIKVLSLLLIPALLLTGCKTEITHKYFKQVDKLNVFLGDLQTITTYYFILDNEQVWNVDRKTYYEYEIGDYYVYTTIKI